MNELVFIGIAIFALSLSLVAFRLGKIYIFALIAIYSLTMNIFVLKQFTIFGFMAGGGNALYGAIFLLTDLLSEHYEKKDAFKAVILGFFTIIVFVILTQSLLLYVPNNYDFAHEHLSALFSLIPRILFGSLFAYIIAQSLDVFIYDKIKIWTNGKYLFLRNNGSTLISQFVDTVLFTAIGMTNFSFLPFDGVFQPSQFWEIVLLTYFLKVIVALIDTPFIYLSYKFLPEELKNKK